MGLQEAAAPSIGAGGGAGEAQGGGGGGNTCEQAGATCLGGPGGCRRRDEEGQRLGMGEQEVLRESQEETGLDREALGPVLVPLSSRLGGWATDGAEREKLGGGQGRAWNL